MAFSCDKTHAFTSHVDSTLRTWRLDGFEGVEQVALAGVAISIAPSRSEPLTVFAVLHTADKLVVVKDNAVLTSHAFDGYEAETVGHSQVTGEVVVGDKKGVIHFFDQASLEEKGLIEKKHNHAITTLTVSEDGTKLATADTYRYIYIFDLAERKEIGC